MHTGNHYDALLVDSNLINKQQLDLLAASTTIGDEILIDRFEWTYTADPSTSNIASATADAAVFDQRTFPFHHSLGSILTAN
jgi:hypothetical protein